VAIDFSLSNMTFDERKSLHTTKQERISEYSNLLKFVSKTFIKVAPATLYYGFGAKLIKGQGEDGPCKTSDLFAGTCDLMNPLVPTINLESQYYKTLQQVELNAPVHISKILHKAIEFSQKAEQKFWEEI